MYASVRKYRVDAGRIDELMSRIDSDFAPRIESASGFVAYQALEELQVGVARLGIVRATDSRQETRE